MLGYHLVISRGELAAAKLPTNANHCRKSDRQSTGMGASVAQATRVLPHASARPARAAAVTRATLQPGGRASDREIADTKTATRSAPGSG